MDDNNDYDSNKINRKFPIKINDLQLENKLEIINHENNDDNDNELGIQNLTTKFSSSSSSSTSNDNHLLINNHQIPTTSRINNDNNHHQQQQQQNNDHQIFKNISSTTTTTTPLSSSLMPVNTTAPVNAIVDISMSSPSSSSLLQPPPPPSPSLSSSISSSPSPSLSATPMKTLSNIVVEKNCLDTDNVDDFHHNREQIIESTNVSNNSDNQYAQDKCQNYSLFQPKQNKQIRTISIDQQPNNVLEIEQINIDDDDDNYNDIESNKRKKTGNRHHRVNNNSDIDDNDDDCNHYARDNIHRINPTTNVGDGVLDESGVRSHSSRRQSHHSSSSSSSSNQNIDYLLSLLPPNDLQMEMPFEDPIQIRGNGNITLFGLFNCYESTFPTALLGRVSKEEFEYTIGRINNLLQQQHSTNIKFLLLGCLCCCFSLGCSLLWPGFALSRRTKNSLEKLLAMENSRLYNKLGLNWRLSKQPSHTNHSFMEYILVIDFLPKIHIYQPD